MAAIDGAVIVADAVVLGFLQWLEAMGLETAVRDAYELEAGKAYFGITAAEPYGVWRDAAQRSALADAVPDPAGRVN